MTILALDLGTRTGWALAEGSALCSSRSVDAVGNHPVACRCHGTGLVPHVESGVQVFDVRRGESPGMRFLRLSRWLEEVARVDHERPQGTATLVVYEQAHHRGGAATSVAEGLVAHVLAFCARYGIEHAAVHSATLKKWTTGSGRGDKGAMRVAAVARGWIGAPAEMDDNEIDALALLHYALAELVARSGPLADRPRPVLTSRP